MSHGAIVFAQVAHAYNTIYLENFVNVDLDRGHVLWSLLLFCCRFVLEKSFYGVVLQDLERHPADQGSVIVEDGSTHSDANVIISLVRHHVESLGQLYTCLYTAHEDVVAEAIAGL